VDTDKTKTKLGET